MTLGNKTFCLSSAVLLAGAIGVAQTAMGGSSRDQDTAAANQSAGAALRGCLSGSAGNYTLTDHNGTIYHLVGGESQLQGSVGHEVEITGTPGAQRTGSSDDMAANTASSFEVSASHEVAARCDHGSGTGSMGTDAQPMTEHPPSTDQQPKGAPGEGAPPQPEPHLMAMLQQPTSPDNSSQSSSTAASPASTENQSPPNGSMANTPVTSQTPAEPASPTGANSQLGRGTTNPSAVGTQPAQSDTNTSSNAATSPQSTQSDQNKPLYERQATDVPWASHSGSTTTTPEPH